MKIAVAQVNSLLGNLERNIEHHISYCKQAIKNNAEVIVFPELSLTGYSLKDINYDICLNPFQTTKLDELKQVSKDISIICGLVEEDEKFAVYNSAAFISEGQVQFTHKKVYPPTYGIFEELRYFSRGEECKVHETKFGKLGLLVCEDLWHMSLPLTQALAGAYGIIGIAASPTRLGVDTESFKNYDINCEHHKTFARLLSLYLVFCNRVGYEDGVNFWGGSEIVDPFGNVIAKAQLFDEDMIYADIDFTEIRRARHQARQFLDEDLNLTVKNLQKLQK